MVDTIYKTFDKNRSKREDEHSIAKYVIYNVEKKQARTRFFQGRAERTSAIKLSDGCFVLI